MTLTRYFHRLLVSLSLLQQPASALGDATLASAVRHFALHALHHLIAQSWNGLNASEKEYIKTQTISIVQNCSALFGSVRFLKQTVVRIVTEIALREWPQQWPTMLDVLFAACTQPPQGASAVDPAGTELLALIFRNMSEEATNTEGSTTSGASAPTEQRRRDVQRGLMSCMESIFPWVLSALKQSVAAFAANKANTQALNNCRALLEALLAMLEFLPAKSATKRISSVGIQVAAVAHSSFSLSLCQMGVRARFAARPVCLSGASRPFFHHLFASHVRLGAQAVDAGGGAWRAARRRVGRVPRMDAVTHAAAEIAQQERAHAQAHHRQDARCCSRIGCMLPPDAHMCFSSVSLHRCWPT